MLNYFNYALVILDTCENFKSYLLGLLLFPAINSNAYLIEKEGCVPYYIEWSVKGDLTNLLIINKFHMVANLTKFINFNLHQTPTGRGIELKNTKSSIMDTSKDVTLITV